MASTRNINQPADYKQQQFAYRQAVDYITNKEYAFANPSYLAGDGLIQGHMPDTLLSGNPSDIESFLFGIGSTNLVKPQGPVTAELKRIPAASIMNKVPLIMPKDLVIENEQRQYPMK